MLASVYLAITSLLLPEILCKCFDTPSVIKCVKMVDLYISKIDTILRDVIIEQEKPENLVLLDKTLFYNNLQYAYSVSIVRQINGFRLEPTIAPPIAIKYLTFSGNSMGRIRNFEFLSNLELVRLSLVDNGITQIGHHALNSVKLQEIDLSYNRLTHLESFFYQNGTRTIIIRNNKLVDIEPYVFPTTLQILDLSHNSLSGNLDSVVSYLVNLKQLSLRSNRLFKIPNVTALNDLKILDLSHNYVENIPLTMFHIMHSLELLDLSHNRLTNVDFLEPVFAGIKKRSSILQVRIHFNQLSEIYIENFENCVTDMVSLTVYGNPWNCYNWQVFKQFVERKQWKQHYCDYQYFATGLVPYCINEYGFGVEERFFVSVRNGMDLVQCNSDMGREFCDQGLSFCVLGHVGNYSRRLDYETCPLA